MVKDANIETMPQMPEVPSDAVDITLLCNEDNQVGVRAHRNRNCELDYKPDAEWVVVLFGGSAVGKDTAMKPLLGSLLRHVVTATSREMRTEGDRKEKGDEYVWMPQPSSEEQKELEEFEALSSEERESSSLPSYVERMIEEFDLVEWDVHHGALYGLPLASLEKTIDELIPFESPVIRTESNGARALLENIGDKYNLLLIGVLPDSYEQIWERLLSDPSLSLEDARKRFADTVEINNALPGLAHFYLNNTSKPVEYPKFSMRRTTAGLGDLIQKAIWDKGQLEEGYREF